MCETEELLHRLFSLSFFIKEKLNWKSFSVFFRRWSGGKLIFYWKILCEVGENLHLKNQYSNLKN